ncbi:MAG: response regulator [Proteobacteria bacterium]|nr:response regulator [Pseudomonadota bacterium]
MARILIIDDEEDVRSTLRQMLEVAGHQVDEAAEGEEGVRRFSLRPHDLVITDILMPVKGGLTTIREIRERYPQAKILAISGGGKDKKLSFLSTARTFPGVRTLGKPFSRADLLTTVQELLASEPAQ